MVRSVAQIDLNVFPHIILHTCNLLTGLNYISFETKKQSKARQGKSNQTHILTNALLLFHSHSGLRVVLDYYQNRENGLFSVVLKLPVGTHRMRFVVDNELRCSDMLPAATDSMGNLVNYIEVGMELDVDTDTDELMEPLSRMSSSANASRFINNDLGSGGSSGSGGTSGGNVLQQAQEWSHQQEQQRQDYQHQNQNQNQNQHQYQHPNESQLKIPQDGDYEMISNDDEEAAALNDGGYERFHEQPPVDPVYKLSSIIPSVFTDPEVMEQFVASDFVTPPQLPPHLESVILNSNSNEKDNNSVLPIPNHVVLNHLVTTSIKHNVLAVASISRYSRKYVTQILYVPL